MIRICLEFLLSRSLDAGKTPTGLLSKLARRDVSLSRFDVKTRQLDALLRSSATEVRESLVVATIDETNALALPQQPPRVQRQAPATDTRQLSSSHSLRWLVGMATAAAMLLILLPNPPRPTKPTVHAGKFSQQLAVVPSEVLNLLNRAAQSTQTRLPQLSPLANLKIPSLPSWKEFSPDLQAPADQESRTWQKNWQNLKTRFSNAEKTS